MIRLEAQWQDESSSLAVETQLCEVPLIGESAAFGRHRRFS